MSRFEVILSRDVIGLQADLIFTELELVGTFLRIAQTSANPETQQRNRAYAREAYAAARLWSSRLISSISLKRAIEERLMEIKSDLERAGEVVD